MTVCLWTIPLPQLKVRILFLEAPELDYASELGASESPSLLEDFFNKENSQFDI